MAYSTVKAQRKTAVNKSRPLLANGKFIPPPPPEEAGDDAFVEWLHRYEEDLEKAGYFEEASDKEYESLEASGEYTFLLKKGLRIKLSPKDCERLAWVAVKTKRDVETLVASWIKERARAEFEKLKKQGCKLS